MREESMIRMRTAISGGARSGDRDDSRSTTVIRREVIAACLLVGIVSTGISATGTAQQGRTAEILQPGAPVLRTLNGNQSHRFAVNLQAKQIAQVVVDQRGIDVLVQVGTPDGSNLAEFDSPNGTVGPEDVLVIAATNGTYSIVVTPLVQIQAVAAGQYEIRLVGVRSATARELKAGRRVEFLKSRGVDVMDEVVAMLQKTAMTVNRMRAQIQAAQLLRKVDEKLARRLITEVAAGMRDHVRERSASGVDSSQHYADLMNMRGQAVAILGPMDPVLALDFIRSTRLPDGWSTSSNQASQELDMEANLAAQLAAADPESAARIAEETLSHGRNYPGMINIAMRLRNSSPALATRIAQAAATRLRGEDLLNNNNLEVANLAVSLLRYSRPPQASGSRAGVTPAAISLLPDEQFRDLLSRSLAETLAFTPVPPENSNAVGAALNLLDALKSIPADVESIAPGRKSCASCGSSRTRTNRSTRTAPATSPSTRCCAKSPWNRGNDGTISTRRLPSVLLARAMPHGHWRSSPGTSSIREAARMRSAPWRCRPTSRQRKSSMRPFAVSPT
jgi:hypothetical protein